MQTKLKATRRALRKCISTARFLSRGNSKQSPGSYAPR